MSVRIYQLSKEIGMDNADLIALLKERGFQVKSASSTVDNISADSLREEFGPSKEAAPEVAQESEKEATPEAKPSIPHGAIVRSKADIERERREREEEEEKQRNTPQTVAPPKVNAPPPLPKLGGPPRVGPPKAGFSVSKPSATPGPQSSSSDAPKHPVLRTDLPPEPEAKEEKSEKPAEESKTGPSAPAPLKPPVVRPPVSGPKSIAPPRVSAPKNLAPPPPVKKPVEEKTEEVESELETENAGEEVVTEKAGSNLSELQVKSPIVVRDFAIQVGRKPFQLISELMELGIFASMNSTIDEKVASQIAENHGYILEVRHRGESAVAAEAIEEEKKVDPENLEPRPPVVCILGHVDHGKTTLLDVIRKSNVVAGEAGGITQHVGAYQIEHKDQKITFIDTPGHAAFSNMRARGANVTDIAVLVVAADDGFMLQTDEALKHARNAGVPVVVAINKIDMPGANIDRVKRQMQERDLSPEDWGGETLSAEISAIKKENIDGLLDAILLQAEVTEGIEANPRGPAEGVIIEAQMELGRGSTAAAIILSGTLKPGTAIVCGENYCRIRQILDDKGKPMKSATPGTPVKIVGWTGMPDAGDNFTTVKNEREAKKIAEANELERKKLEAGDRKETGASIEDLFAAIEKTRKKTYRVVVKADVYGTAEALATSLLGIKSDKIDLEVVDMSVGNITRNDILMASAAECAIVGFNTILDNGVASFAKHHNIKIIQHNIIYELINLIRDGMADMLEPELQENKIGAAEVRQIFPLGRSFVAGCMVTEGRMQRDALARVVRKGEVIHESRIQMLKRFKDDATEVRAGYECGIQIRDFNAYEEGDILEALEILKIKPKL